MCSHISNVSISLRRALELMSVTFYFWCVWVNHFTTPVAIQYLLVMNTFILSIDNFKWIPLGTKNMSICRCLISLCMDRCCIVHLGQYTGFYRLKCVLKNRFWCHKLNHFFFSTPGTFILKLFVCCTWVLYTTETELFGDIASIIFQLIW